MVLLEITSRHAYATYHSAIYHEREPARQARNGRIGGKRCLQGRKFLAQVAYYVAGQAKLRSGYRFQPATLQRKVAALLLANNGANMPAGIYYSHGDSYALALSFVQRGL